MISNSLVTPASNSSGRMIMGDEQGKRQDEKFVEIKEFYTRGRNDIGFFNLEIPEYCIGVLMTITPLDETGKVRGYHTHAIPLMPTPRRHGAKLSIELLPSTVAPTNTNVNVPVVSSQISTVGRTSNFYIQLIPPKSFEKFEPLPMSYVLMTNGRIILTGEFKIEPTKECQTKTVRSVRPEEQTPLTCVFNGTLPIEITREMIPYSTLLVYTLQPTWGFYVAEGYRFSVAGLFPNPLTLNATIVPFTSTETVVDYSNFMKEWNIKPIRFSPKVQDKTRVELSFTGVPDSMVGLNVFEYDGVLQGLSNEITKERLLKYLTMYEQVPFVHMPTMPVTESVMTRREKDIRINDKRESVDEETNKRESIDEETNKDMTREDVKRESSEEELEKEVVRRQGDIRRNGKREILDRVPKEVEKIDKRTISEQDEEELMTRERMGYQVRYPVEKMVFGVSSSRSLPPVEGDDIYTTSSMEGLYGEFPHKHSPHYRRKLEKSINQYDVTVENNDYVITTSLPLVFTATTPSKTMPFKPLHEKHDYVEMN